MVGFCVQMMGAAWYSLATQMLQPMH